MVMDMVGDHTPKRINHSGTRNNPVTNNKRIYRSAGGKWVTREIASLNFLSSIPLGEEASIVAAGQQKKKGLYQTGEKEGSDQEDANEQNRKQQQELLERPSSLSYITGRRLEGDAATVRVQVPLTDTTTVTRQRTIARAAALREWELQTAHGLGAHPPLLEGRLFFSADSSYPVNIYSIVRYEPRREEAAIRRRKVEAIGGGGTRFVLPERDWRGISYRALLDRDVEVQGGKVFNRFVHDLASDDERNETENKEDGSIEISPSDSSEGSHTYIPGLLDDPEMVLGCYRNVMIGDSVIGPIVASTIQFVDPALLKEELNKQFRDRFDGWEPPKSARKYIGAKVIQGNYVLLDPLDDSNDDHSLERRRKRQGSVASASTSSATDGPQDIIRMPPSLTLSKIRSLKQQALQAAVNSNLNIGTLALACVYFERLCLDCRVDKTNRRLSFAACILLASKWSEPNVGLVMKEATVESGEFEETGGGVATRLHSLIRPNKRSGKMFASLLYFFTETWNLSLNHLFAAEWGVFVALGFSLHASPSDVAFHFKRFMKTLEWNAVDYLGSIMYHQWQQALVDDEDRRAKRDRAKIPQLHGHSSG